jgi:hypothetical protein
MPQCIICRWRSDVNLVLVGQSLRLSESGSLQSVNLCSRTAPLQTLRQSGSFLSLDTF